MTFWKAWFDIRKKFYLCWVLVTLLMAPRTVSLAVRAARAPTEQQTSGQHIGQEPRSSLAAFQRAAGGWIEGDAYITFAILATVLAVGGITAQTTASSNLMTLSLPAPRRRWLTAHAVVSALLLGALGLWEGSFIAVTGWVAGLGVPVGRLGVAVILTTLSAGLWIWPAILFTSLTRDAVRAALIVVGLVIALTTFTGLTGSGFLDLGRVASVLRWEEGTPWQPLLMGVALTVLSAWAALKRFERSEF